MITINDLLPILIPSSIMQFGIQAYYIKHCWDNKELTPKQRGWYIAFIALFNLPAAVIYLFLTGKKEPRYPKRDIRDMEANDHIKQGVFVLLIISLEIFSLNVLSDTFNQADGLWIALLLGTGFVLMILNGLWIKRSSPFLYFITPAIEIAAVLLADYMAYSATSHFIVLVIVASIINGRILKHANPYALLTFGLYIASHTLKLSLMDPFSVDTLVRNLYADALIFVLVYAAFYNMKKQLMQNHLLQNAYAELQQQSLQLEEMGAVAERNRIAGEIHDNVGHTLTTAIISIGAGEKLLEKDREAALDKFRLAREQIQNSLNSIRYSVKAIKQGKEEREFLPKLQRMLEEFRKNTGLEMTEVIEIQSELLPIQQNVLLQAMRECVTNSLKHGNSTQVDLLLQEFGGSILFTFSDNGTGTDHIEYGFGLTNMRERVESIGGTLSASSAVGEGFTVTITVPTGLAEAEA